MARSSSPTSQKSEPWSPCSEAAPPPSFASVSAGSISAELGHHPWGGPMKDWSEHARVADLNI